MSYYDRKPETHIDGTRIFQSSEDRDREQEIASMLEKAWGCRMGRFGALSPIDWFAERRGRLVGLAELKSRSHSRDRFPTVFLNVRKWLALSLGSVGLGCPSIFVVRFDDGEALWVDIASVDATKNKIGGCLRIVKSVNDIEPVIEVPIALMKPVSADSCG